MPRAMSVTAVNTQTGGYLTIYPCNAPRPLAANVTYGTGTTISNAVITKLAPNGTICIYTHAATDLVIDTNGYFPTG